MLTLGERNCSNVYLEMFDEYLNTQLLSRAVLAREYWLHSNIIIELNGDTMLLIKPEIQAIQTHIFKCLFKGAI